MAYVLHALQARQEGQEVKPVAVDGDWLDLACPTPQGADLDLAMGNLSAIWANDNGKEFGSRRFEPFLVFQTGSSELCRVFCGAGRGLVVYRRTATQSASEGAES